MAKFEFVRHGISDETREKLFEALRLEFKNEYDRGWHRGEPITAEAIMEVIDKIDDIVRDDF